MLSQATLAQHRRTYLAAGGLLPEEPGFLYTTYSGAYVRLALATPKPETRAQWLSAVSITKQGHWIWGGQRERRTNLPLWGGQYVLPMVWKDLVAELPDNAEVTWACSSKRPCLNPAHLVLVRQSTTSSQSMPTPLGPA